MKGLVEKAVLWLVLKFGGQKIAELVVEFVKNLLDAILDAFERAAAKTETDVDDKVVAYIREELGIPEGDD